MEQETQKGFRQGCRDGIAIALGYVSVSFTFGMMAVSAGIPLPVAVAISFTNLTSAGQFAALRIIASAGSLTEMALTQLVINLRYALMSLSLSQKVKQDIPTWKRMLMSYGITDEIFALSFAQEGKITFSYYCGLMVLPILGWCGGTLLGGAIHTLLSETLREALGIAIYAMFLAIIIPPAKASPPIRQVILCAAFISCFFALSKPFLAIGSGFAIIITAVIAAALLAYLHPLSGGDEQ